MKILVKHSHLITTVLVFVICSPLYAIDEDYFIPYTDNYGYEYDPETQTYIKKDRPAPVAANGPETDNTQTVQSAVTPEPASVAPQPPAGASESSSRLHLILIGVVVILGFGMVLARKLKKTTLGDGWR